MNDRTSPGARTRPRVFGWALLALTVGVIPLWSTAAHAQQPSPSTPPTETCGVIDFEKATVEPIATTGTSTRYRLTVSGNQPYFQMSVKLVPHVYVQQPDYWGIEVTGCRSGDVGLPVVVPYTVTYDFTGPLGKRGIEVIGSVRTQRFDLVGRPAPPSPLAGTSWTLVPGSLGVPVPPGRTVTANFSDTRVTGATSCNLFAGDYKTAGNRIRIGAILTTRIACTPETAAAESAYLKKLNAATSFATNRSQLLLFGQAGTLRFRSAKPEPPAAPGFVGTWRVTGIFGGTPGAIVPVIDGTVIMLTFNADGSLGGRACNSYGSTWKADGSSIGIAPVAATKIFCAEPPGVMPQESRYFAALQGAASWTVDAGQLTLTDGNGRAVVTAVAAIR